MDLAPKMRAQPVGIVGNLGREGWNKKTNDVRFRQGAPDWWNVSPHTSRSGRYHKPRRKRHRGTK